MSSEVERCRDDGGRLAEAAVGAFTALHRPATQPEDKNGVLRSKHVPRESSTRGHVSQCPDSSTNPPNLATELMWPVRPMRLQWSLAQADGRTYKYFCVAGHPTPFDLSMSNGPPAASFVVDAKCISAQPTVDGLMTEKRSVRPPVAPKPSFIQHNVATPTPSPAPSPALRGATSAFAPGLMKPIQPSAVQSPSTGALAAAAAVGKKQPTHINARPNVAQLPEASTSTGPRGRSMTAEEHPPAIASRTLPISPGTSGFFPHAPRSTSAVAAVAASTRTSPVRSELRRDKPETYQLKAEDLVDARKRAVSTNGSGEPQHSQAKGQAALAGAVASMAAVASQLAAQRTGERQKQEQRSGAYISLASSHPSIVSSPSPSGATAAATATRNAAALDLARRTFAPSTAQSRASTPPREASVPRLSSTGPSWRHIKVTPPQTDSDSEAVQAVLEQTRKPLPAPIPLRPARAAMVAQEKANSSGKAQSHSSDPQSAMTVNALADAMVAGSIASSHAPSRMHSPAVKPPPPKPRRRSKSVGLFEGARHLKNLPGLSKGSDLAKLEPLPARPMRHTLRNTSPEHEDRDEEPTKRGRRHWRRHPNMHHEGDRKRWRDKVTERERKRYEGVWAANRGVLLEYDQAYVSNEGANDLVLNVVARDIWDRSRLPHDVLEEIWDLVAPPEAKALNREEFVVGLWLIDQRLKGRKLPVKVTASVWSSVRHIHGVKISSKPIPK